jgi:hypothetical protein
MLGLWPKVSNCGMPRRNIKNSAIGAKLSRSSGFAVRWQEDG